MPLSIVPSRSRSADFFIVTAIVEPFVFTSFFQALPSSRETEIVGILTVSSTPDMPGAPAPGALFAMITATAPASWAIFALITKLQVPRSSSAIMPVSEPAGSAVQARVALAGSGIFTSALMS